MTFPFCLVLNTLLCFIVTCHTVLIVMASVPLAWRATQITVIFQMVVDYFSLFVVLLSLVRKYLDFGAEPSNVRLMVTFLTLWLAGGSLVLTLNIHGRYGPNFIGVAFSDAYNLTFLGLSWAATGSALTGLFVSYFDVLPGVIKVKPRKYLQSLPIPSSQLASSGAIKVRPTEYQRSLPPTPSSQLASSKAEYQEWSTIDLSA